MRTFFITDQEEIDQIILSCEHCFVGISEKDGSPYVFPMNFAYADGVIILHSGPHGKHLQLLETDNRVCVTFCTENNKILYQHPDVACSYSMQSKSVLCKGKIEFVENQEEKERLIKLFMRHFTICRCILGNDSIKIFTITTHLTLNIIYNINIYKTIIKIISIT